MNLRFSKFAISKPVIDRQKPKVSARMLKPVFVMERIVSNQEMKISQPKFENAAESILSNANGNEIDLTT